MSSACASCARHGDVQCFMVLLCRSVWTVDVALAVLSERSQVSIRAKLDTSFGP